MQFLQTNPNVAYNPTLKEKFRKEAKKFLDDLKKFIPHSDASYKWNPGGIAVSGEATLKLFSKKTGHGVYILLSTGPLNDGLMFRIIKHFDDHSGGLNQYLKLEKFQNPRQVADYIMRGARWQVD